MVFIRVRIDLPAHRIPENERIFRGTKDLAKKNVENILVSVFNKEYHGDFHMPNSLLKLIDWSPGLMQRYILEKEQEIFLFQKTWLPP